MGRQAGPISSGFPTARHTLELMQLTPVRRPRLLPGFGVIDQVVPFHESITPFTLVAERRSPQQRPPRPPPLQPLRQRLRQPQRPWRLHHQSAPPSPTHWWQAEGNANDSVGMDNGTLVGVTFGPGCVWNRPGVQLWRSRRIKSFSTRMAATLVRMPSRSRSLIKTTAATQGTGHLGEARAVRLRRDQLLGGSECSPTGVVNFRGSGYGRRRLRGPGFNGGGQRRSVALGGGYQAGDNGIAVCGRPASGDGHDFDNR